MNIHSILDSESMIGVPVLSWAKDHQGTVILESTARDRIDFRSYLFAEPSAILVTHTPDQVTSCLTDVEHAVRQGSYAAGFMSYEAGCAFEDTGEFRSGALPLLWFGIYENPLILDLRRQQLAGGSPSLRRALTDLRRTEALASGPPSLHPNIEQDEYVRAFSRVQDLIAAGDTYQVNLTFKLLGKLEESSAYLYDRMRRNQQVKYGAFVNLGTHSVLSCSPELFFRSDGKAITLRPMKGTAERGRTSGEDLRQKERLYSSAKNRAENMMIVDLLRNDAGRVAKPGTVEVKRFFDIERYETVFQATSTIRAILRKDVTIGDLVRCLFPSGSVTGAPKIRTMQIIRELEREPRGIYTGSIGFFGPKRKAAFNVAIRTAVVDERSRSIELGVGSGVIHDSVAADEYAECLAKARFIGSTAMGFDLLETIRWDPVGGLGLLRLHQRRLKESAGYFGFRYEAGSIRSALGNVDKMLRRKETQPHRVRLLLSQNGEVRVEFRPLGLMKGSAVVGLSEIPVDSKDRFLFHKTTFRPVYEQALALAEQRGLFDVVFCNEKQEITEGARSNIILRVGDHYFTPPLDAGLLPGIFRESLLRGQGLPLQEKTLYPDDLYTADEVFVCNALRGLIKVSLESKEGELKDGPSYLVAED